MRITSTPNNHSEHPVKYWIEVSENILAFGTNNDDGYIFVLVDENIDWLINYLRNKSALMIPQIVQALISNQNNFSSAKAELIRL